MDINALFSACADAKASDLHLSAGQPVMFRIDGEVQSQDDKELSAVEVLDLIRSCTTDDQFKIFQRSLECDFSLDTPSGRFRANVYYQQRGPAAAFRFIPPTIPTLDTIQAPAVLKDIADLPRGLVLVTGPTGSGKSTTCAALIDRINETRRRHILTIEDPIEYIHTRKMSLVNQRELGQQTSSFPRALRSALREDPDVILIGELRDLDTIRLALTAAETGHLVFATLHTSGAAKTIDRIIDVFPAGEKELVRAMLASSLKAIIAQLLIPKREGGGRVAVHEILIGTPAARNLIRENKIPQLHNVLQTGSNYGMQTLEQALQQLIDSRTVGLSTARALVEDPEKLQSAT